SGGRAAYAVDAVAAVAFGPAAADLAQAFLAARPVVADVDARTVRVAAARRVTRRAVAEVVAARLCRGWPTGPAAVADAGQRRHRGRHRTRRRYALRAGGVELTSTGPVAKARGPAAGRPL